MGTGYFFGQMTLLLVMACSEKVACPHLRKRGANLGAKGDIQVFRFARGLMAACVSEKPESPLLLATFSAR